MNNPADRRRLKKFAAVAILAHQRAHRAAPPPVPQALRTDDRDALEQAGLVAAAALADAGRSSADALDARARVETTERLVRATSLSMLEASALQTQLAGRARTDATSAVATAATAQAAALEARRLSDEADAHVRSALVQVAAIEGTAGQARSAARAAAVDAASARAKAGEVPGLLATMKAGVEALAGEALHLAGQALRKLTELGVVLRTIEQRGYLLVGHYSNGEERQVAQLPGPEQQFLLSGGGAVGGGGSSGSTAIVVTTSNNYFLTTNDGLVVVDTTDGVARTVTLPATSSASGQTFTIKRRGTGLVAVTTAAPDKFDMLTASEILYNDSNAIEIAADAPRNAWWIK